MQSLLAALQGPAAAGWLPALLRLPVLLVALAGSTTAVPTALCQPRDHARILACRRPPLQDAHNLAWKLAAVVQGHAPKQLLRSYEAERRPIAQANTALSVANWREAMKVGTAVLLRTLLGHML